MNAKKTILANLCYTELVYGRINKKMKTAYSRQEIEDLLVKVLLDTEEKDIVRTGKNYYVCNGKHGIRITVNANTFRVITVDRLG